MAALTTAVVSGGLFQGNQVTGSEGGGMIVVGALEMTGTQFIENTSAGAVGGLATGSAAAHLTNVQFISNSAVFEAGAFANLGVATITNGLFQFNQGGAIRRGARRSAHPHRFAVLQQLGRHRSRGDPGQSADPRGYAVLHQLGGQ